MNPNQPRSVSRPLLKQVHHGSHEAIFQVLPEDTWRNFLQSHSENTLLWNLIYPLFQPALSLRTLLDIIPLWGIPSSSETPDDWMIPFFWGYDVSGGRLPTLDITLELVDGTGPKTEVDLILLGERNVILVEAKNQGAPGRCSRYQMTRCPEIHDADRADLTGCQYWDEGKPVFTDVLDLGSRPDTETDSPPCNLHYQLARTLLIGKTLAENQGLRLGIWLILPRRRWSSIRRTWLDFKDRVCSDEVWRGLRVLAWEDIQQIDPPRPKFPASIE